MTTRGATPAYGLLIEWEQLRGNTGASTRRPRPDALETLTGQREMDATAIRDYFGALQK